MAAYSCREYADMVLMYGRADCSARAALNLYEQRFPLRRPPSVPVILGAVARMFESGNLMPNRHETGAPRRVRNPENEEAIIDAAMENPQIGIRGIARELNVSYGTVQRTLKDENLHAFHYRKVQQLREGDYPVRIEFCREILRRYEENPNFIRSILFTDESSFGRSGFWNTRNFHYYAVENPHVITRQKHQDRFSLNIWAGLHLGHGALVGPFEFDENLNADVYTDFLQNHLEPLCLQAGITQQEFTNQLWFQQDGAPAHTAGVSQAWLHAHFPDRYIGRGGILDWPPRSPDLNPLDFFLWGHVKSLVYRDPIDDLEQLHERIHGALQQVTQEMINNCAENFIKRLRCCIEMGGNNFEHLIH